MCTYIYIGGCKPICIDIKTQRQTVTKSVYVYQIAIGMRYKCAYIYISVYLADKSEGLLDSKERNRKGELEYT